jgi:hypothetical protein
LKEDFSSGARRPSGEIAVDFRRRELSLSSLTDSTFIFNRNPSASLARVRRQPARKPPTKEENNKKHLI